MHKANRIIMPVGNPALKKLQQAGGYKAVLAAMGHLVVVVRLCVKSDCECIACIVPPFNFLIFSKSL